MGAMVDLKSPPAMGPRPPGPSLAEAPGGVKRFTDWPWHLLARPGEALV